MSAPPSLARSSVRGLALSFGIFLLTGCAPATDPSSNRPVAGPVSNGGDTTAAPNSSLPAGTTPAQTNDCRPGTATLREAGCGIEVLVGAAVRPALLDSEGTRSIIEREFSSVTPENELKWTVVQPSRGQFDFVPADRLLDFASANGISVKGHTLVWDQAAGNGIPQWVADIADPAELDQVLQDHITTVMGRYAGRITRWDVVNEPLVGFGTERYQGHFAQVLGPRYIAHAFELARAADPHAKLYLNEHSVEASPARADALVALVAELVDQGVPIDGVGLQTHLFTGNPPEPGVIEGLVRRLRSLGLDVSITELDVPLPPGLESDTATEAGLRRQADVYRQVVGECLAAGCNEITMWGVDDAHTWLNTYLDRVDTRPLLFDAGLQPKPAHRAVLDALLEAPPLRR